MRLRGGLSESACVSVAATRVLDLEMKRCVPNVARPWVEHQRHTDLGGTEVSGTMHEVDSERVEERAGPVLPASVDATEGFGIGTQPRC